MSGFTVAPLSTPVFHFPPEPKRKITTPSLISILRHCQSLAGYATARKQTRAQYSADALDKIARDPEHKRVIFRRWPRAANGVGLSPHKSLPGKAVPNDVELWGETMFDFYRTYRSPDMKTLVTLTTGSKMMAFAKANNEVEVARGEVDWAETENDPKLLEPYSIKKLLENQERSLRLGLSGKSSRKMQVDVDMDDPSISSNLFHPSNLPSPWPFLPFSYQADPLQVRMPLHRLPETITVHDPWNVLAVKSTNHFGCAQRPETADWANVPDRMLTYRLRLTSAGKARVKQELAAAVSAGSDDGEKATGGKEFFNQTQDDGFFLDPPAAEGPMPPAVWILPPPRPEKIPRPPLPKTPRHGHLYLSPTYKLGEGNHSVVYEAEWDLPRAIIAEEDTPEWVYCKECARDSVRDYLKEKDARATEREKKSWSTPSATCKKIVTETPEFAMEIVEPNGKTRATVITSPGSRDIRYTYEGEVRTIQTSSGWQDPRNPTCSHIKPVPTPPPIARVRVVAKLSKCGDEQIVQEADNYQKFEQHMFQHWSGLNLIEPCHDPVPIGPVVPQFFGYYAPLKKKDTDDPYARLHSRDTIRVPQALDMIEGRFTVPYFEDVATADANEKDTSVDTDDRDSESGEDDIYDNGYFSPILLQELCGTQIQPKDLTEDESNEVASLFLRFHREGWVHNSVYARNVLYQYGPLHVPYSQRKTSRYKRQLSFRLIDFGRSILDTTGEHKMTRAGEEQTVDRLFSRRLYRDGEMI